VIDVALIPPVALLDMADSQKYQLMLPHMMSNPTYARRYKEYCADPNKAVIMDNGAAEGEQTTVAALFHYAMEWTPHEVAAPDVLTNRVETVDRSLDFVGKYGSALNDAGIGIGYVAQGFDLEDAMTGVREAMSNFYFDVIYIPRLLVHATHLTTRLELAELVYKEYEEAVDIHLFGASVFWPRELVFATQRPHIRSIDTSMPFSYAHSSMSLMSRGQISRPVDYFNLPEFEFPNADIYVKAYLKWAR
jgi:hypothetical protein